MILIFKNCRLCLREGNESRPDFSSKETRIYVRTKKNFLPKKTGITSEGKYDYLRMKINFSPEEKPARREKDKITTQNGEKHEKGQIVAKKNVISRSKSKRSSLKK